MSPTTARSVVGGDEADFDPQEVSELRWFTWDDLPPDLAPPGTLSAVLEAARRADPAPILDRR